MRLVGTGRFSVWEAVLESHRSTNQTTEGIGAYSGMWKGPFVVSRVYDHNYSREKAFKEKYMLLLQETKNAHEAEAENKGEKPVTCGIS